MLRVGLTGGLGSGKSTIARMFRALGAQVTASDEIGRQLMQPGGPVYEEIVRAFGSGVVQADGALDRNALADLAFQQNRFRALTRIVHPAVVAAEEEWMRGVFARDPGAVAIVESALIFEAEREGTAPAASRRFDKLILVTVPDAIKIARFVSRMASAQGGPGAHAKWERDARARLAAQIPDEEKAALCDYVIENFASPETARPAVEAIYRELESLARRPPR